MEIKEPGSEMNKCLYLVHLTTTFRIQSAAS